MWRKSKSRNVWLRGSEVHWMQLVSLAHSSTEVVVTSSSKEHSCQDFLAAFQAPQWSLPPPPPLRSACWLSSTSPAINLLPLSSQEAQAYRKIPPLLGDTDDWRDWEEGGKDFWSHWVISIMKCLEWGRVLTESNLPWRTCTMGVGISNEEHLFWQNSCDI